jgi:uncharacterized protein
MLHLSEIAKQGQQTRVVRVEERLPVFLTSPCHMNVTFHIEAKDDFYLIYLKAAGNLNIVCQRCMQEFCFPYDNETIIAVCRSDERAEQLLAQYECIVSSNGSLDLNDLVIDELHLYAPQFHPDLADCGDEINQILTTKPE